MGSVRVAEIPLTWSLSFSVTPRFYKITMLLEKEAHPLRGQLLQAHLSPLLHLPVWTASCGGRGSNPWLQEQDRPRGGWQPSRGSPLTSSSSHAGLYFDVILKHYPRVKERCGFQPASHTNLQDTARGGRGFSCISSQFPH